MIRPLKEFQRLNPDTFRAFLAAAETLNFTHAAKAAAMTQSGVSQHIAKLESDLGVPLFIRSNKSVFLTEAGRELATYIERYLDETDALCERLVKAEKALEGLVTYAMPSSCLHSPHLSMMLEKRKKFPAIELKILIRSNEEIIQSLLGGEIDFGFITKQIDAPGLRYIHFCSEEFVLVTPPGFSCEKDIESVAAAPFVSYPGMQIYFEAWQQHHFPKAKKRYFDSLNIAGHVESIDGAITLVSGGVGCIAIPRHCVQARLENDLLALHAVDKSSKNPLINPIYITTLESRTSTRRATQVMNWFFEMHPEIKR